MAEIRPLILVQALSPTSRTAFSEASLCGILQKKAPTRVLCRRWSVDYSFARSFGLTDIIEYEPLDVLRALRSPGHWLRVLLNETSVFHMNGYGRWEDPLFALLCLRHRVPYLVQPRGALGARCGLSLPQKLFHRGVGKFVFGQAKNVLALSQFEGNELMGLGISSEKIRVFPNGVTFPSSLAAPARSSKAHPGIPSDPYFFYLGRIEASKNLLFLLDVIHLYRKTGGASSLYLMGPSTDGYHSVIQKRISELHLNDRVFLLSPSYDEARWHWLSGATALIYPTLDEPFGRVPFEALFAGVLAVVPDSGGSAEYLRPLLPECVFASSDPGDLCRILREVEAFDEATRKKMVARASKWIETELDWERIGDHIVSLYAQMTGLAATPPPTRKSAHVKKA